MQSSNILDSNYNRENVDSLFFPVGDTQSFSTTQLTTNQARIIPPPNCNYTIDEFHIFNPDTRSGSLKGFHSTDRTFERQDYFWVRPITDPLAADYETFSAEFGIPNQPQFGTKVSSFFPRKLPDTEVLRLIGNGYIQSGCKPTGEWNAIVINPLTGLQMPLRGYAFNYLITSAHPSVPRNIF